MKDQAADKADELSERAQEVADKVADHISEVADNMKESARGAALGVLDFIDDALQKLHSNSDDKNPKK